jgi:hypothetical protein
MFLDGDTEPYYDMTTAVFDGEYPAGNYFYRDFFVLFNLAVGGDFPQIYDPSKISALDRDNNFTASLYVDYLRFYDPEGVLVWNDEFDGSALDESWWNVEVNDFGGGNNEIQSYRRENVSLGPEPVSGKNCLVLSARRE